MTEALVTCDNIVRMQKNVVNFTLVLHYFHFNPVMTMDLAATICLLSSAMSFKIISAVCWAKIVFFCYKKPRNNLTPKVMEIYYLYIITSV